MAGPAPCVGLGAWELTAGGGKSQASPNQGQHLTTAFNHEEFLLLFITKTS